MSVTMTKPVSGTDAVLAENARLQAQAQAKAIGRITLKRSEKGGLSVYGLGRFPVTLYREQWEALMGQRDQILEACKGLQTKAEKQEQAKSQSGEKF